MPVVLVVAIVIFIIPIGIERYTENWLYDQGVTNPSIDDVDFNPFTGVLRVKSFSISEPGKQNGNIGFAEANFEWTALFARRLSLSSFTANDGQVVIQRHADGSITIGALRWPLDGSREQVADDVPRADSPTWAFGLNDVTFNDIDITYRDEIFDSKVELQRITLDKLAMWDPEHETNLDADFRLDDAEIRLRASATPLVARPRFTSDLVIDGLALEKYSALFRRFDVDRSRGSLSLDLESMLDVGQDDTLLISSEGTVELGEVGASLPTLSVQSDRLLWAGNVAAAMSKDATTAPQFSGTSKLRVSGFAINHLNKPIRLASFDELTVEDATAKDLNDIRVGEVSIQAFELLRKGEDDPTVRIEGAIFKNLGSLNQSIFSVEEIIFDGVAIQMQREKSGELRVVSETISDFTQSSTEIAADQATEIDETASEKSEIQFLIGRLEIGGDSAVQFNDFAVDPPLSTRLVINTSSLTNFGNFDLKQPVHLLVDLQQDDSASLVGEGDIKLFDGQISGDITLAVKGLDLTQVSSYVPGYNIQRGRLSLDSRADLVGESLDVKNTVLVEGLSLSRKDVGDKDLLGAGMDMPLDLALDLLRDSDDRIKLELPISGSLNDPKFGTGDIVRIAMQNAMQRAAMSYVKNALQPLGTIMLVAKVAGEAARPRFKPVAFEPGSAQLTAESRAYVDKIAQVLKERPGLSVTFCGVSTQADWDHFVAQIDVPPDLTAEELPSEPPSFEAERLQLAQSRGTTIQRYLALEHAVEAERLFRCRPTVEFEGDAGPRVEITL